MVEVTKKSKQNQHLVSIGTKILRCLRQLCSVDPQASVCKSIISCSHRLDSILFLGKTTAAQLVCEHLNLEFIEKNASDQRSKKAMAAITNDSYSLGQLSKSSSSMSKYVLIMDEVDGVAGNEDRGGVQELILLIKRSRIPIICICNDRQHKKIRSLASYCYDLRFSRPTVQQIRGYMLSILHRENLPEMKTNVLDEIIQSCNQDIRQTIHSLNLWASKGETTGENAAKMIDKNVDNNPFELCRLSFSNEFRTKSISEKSDIFFSDYQLMPLLVQENYLSTQPNLSSAENSKRKLTDLEHLNLLSAAADSISLGDICSQMIFSRNDSWSLLPYQVTSLFSSKTKIKNKTLKHLGNVFYCRTLFICTWTFTWCCGVLDFLWTTFSNEQE